MCYKWHASWYFYKYIFICGLWSKLWVLLFYCTGHWEMSLYKAEIGFCLTSSSSQLPLFPHWRGKCFSVELEESSWGRNSREGVVGKFQRFSFAYIICRSAWFLSALIHAHQCGTTAVSGCMGSHTAAIMPGAGNDDSYPDDMVPRSSNYSTAITLITWEIFFKSQAGCIAIQNMNGDFSKDCVWKQLHCCK